MGKKLFILFIGVIGLAFIFLYQKFTLEDGKLHVVFCDVGQGDAIFITTPNGSDILIDGGPDSRVLPCLSRHMPFWDRTLEMVVLTHLHTDHLTGLIDVIERYSILYFIESVESVGEETEGTRVLHSKLSEKGILVKKMGCCEKVLLQNEATLLVLWPDRSFVSREAFVNETSLVMLLSYQAFDVLLTGDAGVNISYDLRQKERLIEILKVPHHGSKTGMDEAFLDRVRPRLAVISVGKNNRYGHPAAETLQILKDKDIKILRTDVDGEIEVVSDGKTWNVKTKR